MTQATNQLTTICGTGYRSVRDLPEARDWSVDEQTDWRISELAAAILAGTIRQLASLPHMTSGHTTLHGVTDAIAELRDQRKALLRNKEAIDEVISDEQFGEAA